MKTPLAILSTGMVSAVGNTASSSCAAIRCSLDNNTETAFIDDGGEFIFAAQVEWPDQQRGIGKLCGMLVSAVRECLAFRPDLSPAQIPILIGVSERSRPGRFAELETELTKALGGALGCELHKDSAFFPFGRMAGVEALVAAHDIIAQGKAEYCIVAGADNLIVGPTLAFYQKQQRLKTSKNSDGFIPGEAACALLVHAAGKGKQPELVWHGIGRGLEPATLDSEKPHRADGLVQAITAAFSDSGKTYADLHYRMTDATGEQYWFKDAALALARTMRQLKESFDIRHVGDCLGETSAANVPCALAAVLTAAKKGYAPREYPVDPPGTGVLCQFSGDDGVRCVLVLTWENNNFKAK